MRADRPSSLERRRFLTVSALAGGGLMLGIALPEGRAAAAPATGRLNAYIRIDPQGVVTLLMPNVEMGQGTFTSLPILICEELEVGLDQVHLDYAPPDPKVYGIDGDQSTGGSMTIRSRYLPLREAGATARMLLVRAAARGWKVPESACHAERGEVVHAASGRRIGYGLLASTAAQLRLPAKVKLKEPKDWKLIGRSTHRRDAPSKTDGSAIFGIDVRLPGMRHAAVARSPVEGGTVASLDSAAAQAVPGVRQVVNEGDVVAVVADNTHAALTGIAALRIRWNDGPNAKVQQADLVRALEAAAGGDGAVARQVGDARAALKGATRVLEATYHQPFLAHATLEPLNCTVHFQHDLCEVWTGTQAPDRLVDKLVEIGIPRSSIRLHNQLIGGGFGRRLDVDMVVVAARIARKVQGPVQVLWRREEDMQHDVYRPYYVDRIRAGLDADGRPHGWVHTIAGSAVTARWNGAPLKNGIDDDAVQGSADPVYAFKDLDVRYVQQDPTGVPTGWWRGVGPTRSLFVVESFIDELAAAAGQDPAAYRRPLLKDARLRAVFDLAIAKSGWGTPLPKGRGRGISIQSEFGSYLAQVAEVEVRADGSVRVERVVCAIDCGQIVNPDGVIAQMEGGVIFGLGAALTGEITIANGRVEQGNFGDYPVLRLPDAPRVEAHLVASTEAPGGVGEPGTAGIAAAVCNAVFAATGKRVRTLPLSRGLQA